MTELLWLADGLVRAESFKRLLVLPACQQASVSVGVSLTSRRGTLQMIISFHLGVFVMMTTIAGAL